MAANSPLRRASKRLLAPVLGERLYPYVQCLPMAWDIWRGRFTEPELDLLPAAVRPGDTVVDIGANYGVYSYHLDRAVGATGRVFAFEPVPFTFRTLCLVARLLRFRGVELIAKGCGDRPGTVTFTVPLQDSGAPSAGQAHLGSRNDERAGKERHVRWPRRKEVTCEVVALDDFLPPVADLSFIKCDIEGAELLAFRGAEKTINRHLPTVLCEINPWFLDGFGITLDDLTGFFLRKGYRLYRYKEEARLLNEVVPGDVVEDNYVFAHPRRAERLTPFLAPSVGDSLRESGGDSRSESPTEAQTC
jgi:FkbM family methyltransferase